MTVSDTIVRGAMAAAVVLALTAGCAKQTENAKPVEEAAAPAASESTSHSVVGKAPAAVNGIVSVVVLEPQDAREYPAPPQRPFMDQLTQTFVPAMLFVRTGYPVDFKNSDDVLHNVRVREEATRAGTFNVAIPTGQIYSHTFERDGFYDVGCDIHPGMSAQIIATRSPYATLADPAGNFSFENVEPGGYKVAIYSGIEKIEKTIEVTGAVTTVGE